MCGRLCREPARLVPLAVPLRGPGVSVSEKCCSDYSHDVSPYEYPEDEFDARNDEAHEPVGVHRAPVPAWRGWVSLLAVIVIVPLLAWAAVTLLGRMGYTAPSAQESASSAAKELTGEETAETTEPAEAAEVEEPAAAEPEQAEAQTPEQSADLTTGVTIHNGSSVNGLAGRTGDRLTNVGYTDVHVQQGVYRQSAPETTTIYYASADNEATARAIGEALGIANVVESAEVAQSNPVVIVLRSDFTE